MNNLQERINERVENYRDEIVKTLQKLIQIKSVETESERGKPFGLGVSEVLEVFLQAAGVLKLKNENFKGYAGHVEIGDGEDIVGILCHLDVVPEGDDWTYPPYGGEIHDNKIYGRGTVDDKGPAVAALYALKVVDDLDLDLKKKIRLIVGTDEESGWEGMEYYKENAVMPDIGFSPDASYPVIHSEKGIINFKMEKIFQSKQDNVIEAITGGNAPNMVPDYCEAVLDISDIQFLEESLEDYVTQTGAQIKIFDEGDKAVLRSTGVSAHGSRPEDGVNAVSQLLLFLNSLNLPRTDLQNFLKVYAEKIGKEYYGESLNCDVSDKSGRLTFNVGMIDLTQDQVKLVVNIRYPVTYDGQEIMERLQNQHEFSDYNFEITEHKQPLYVAKDDPLVQKLMKVYEDVTGDSQDPIAIGGGTYARVLDKGVAFGPLFPGQPELAHQKDECIDIDDLLKNVSIYARAVIELAGGNADV